MFMIPYDHRLETIDEQLAKLIAERLEISKGTNGYPTKELLDQWCEKFQVDRHIIGQVFASMNNPRRTPRLPASPQNLRDIIPVMKQVTIDGVTYQITRMEQYVDFSLVYVEVYMSEDADTAELNVQLMLNGEPNEGRQVQFHRSHGQTNQASVAYMVTPQLPNDLKIFSFQLVPSSMPRHPRPPERILDQGVVFN